MSPWISNVSDVFSSIKSMEQQMQSAMKAATETEQKLQPHLPAEEKQAITTLESAPDVLRGKVEDLVNGLREFVFKAVIS